MIKFFNACFNFSIQKINGKFKKISFFEYNHYMILEELVLNKYFLTYIVLAHLFLLFIILDRHKNRFFSYFGKCLYIINNYINRSKNIYNQNRKEDFQKYYNPIIEKNKEDVEEDIKKSSFLFNYFILYLKFILFIWWAYLIYILVANILLFLDESLGD